MCIKRFALLVMSVCVISGFSATRVSAAEGDSIKQNTDAVSKVTETTVPDALLSTTADMPVVTETPVVSDTVATQTPVIEVTQPVVTTTSTPVATKASGKKTTKKKSKKKVSYTKSELRLMASIINCEAGSESYQGKLAVGVVVMNRIKSKSFPNSLKKVIFQKYQFSPVRNGSLRKRLSQYDAGKTGSKQWKDCISAAKKTLEGQNTIVMKGKVKSLKGYHFFSVRLAGAKIKLGGHRFK